MTPRTFTGRPQQTFLVLVCDQNSYISVANELRENIRSTSPLLAPALSTAPTTAINIPTARPVTDVPEPRTHVDARKRRMFDALRRIAETKDFVSPDAIRAAEEFVGTLPEDIAEPWIAAASDGEVGFYWKSDKYHVDLGFYGDSYSYFARAGTKKWGGDDDIEPGVGLPDDLLDVLRSV